MNKTKISWEEFRSLVKELYNKVKVEKGWSHISGIYGIPRGGQYVALMLSEISGTPMTDVITKDVLVVDDIADSGNTLSRFHGRGCGVATLHVKPHSVVKPHLHVKETKDWVVYPYEVEKDETIQDNVRRTLELIGENPNREGIKYTPHRVERMWTTALYSYRKKLKVMNEKERNIGQHGDIIPITTFECEKDDMVVRKTNFISFCEHHMVPFFGCAYIGIIPGDILMGMSKIDKVVKYFAARLQIQERLGGNIVDWLMDNIKPKGVIVVINARHMCAEIQGDDGHFTTSAVRGIFLKPGTGKSPKEEFLKLIDMGK